MTFTAAVVVSWFGLERTWEDHSKVRRLTYNLVERSLPRCGGNCRAPAQTMWITISPFPRDAEKLRETCCFLAYFPDPETLSCNYQKMQFTPSFSFSSLNICVTWRQHRSGFPGSFSLVFSLSFPFLHCCLVEWTLTSCYGTSFGSFLTMLGFFLLSQKV